MSTDARVPVIYHHVHPGNFGSICDLACAYVRDSGASDSGFRVSVAILYDCIHRFAQENSIRVPVLFEFTSARSSWVVRFRVPTVGIAFDALKIESLIRESIGESNARVKNLLVRGEVDAKALEVFLGSNAVSEEAATAMIVETHRVELGDLDYRKLLSASSKDAGTSSGEETVYRVSGEMAAVDDEVQVVKGGVLSGLKSAAKGLFSRKKSKQAVDAGEDERSVSESPKPHGLPAFGNHSARPEELRERDQIIHELREKLRDSTRSGEQLRLKIRDFNVKEQNWVAKMSQADATLLAEKTEKNRLLAIIKDLREKVAVVSRSIDTHRGSEVAEMRSRLDHSIREEARLRSELAKREMVEEQKQVLLRRIEDLQSQVNAKAVSKDTKGVQATREHTEFFQRQISEMKRMNQKLLERIVELESDAKNREKEENHTDIDKLRSRLEESLKVVVKYRKEAEFLKLRVDELVRENELLKVEAQKNGKGGKAA